MIAPIALIKRAGAPRKAPGFPDCPRASRGLRTDSAERFFVKSAPRERGGIMFEI